MRKLFSFILVALMSIMTLNAESMRIYCKMSQSWWTADGAAVGCHSWGSGPGTDWPGVRMTPVDGVADTWYIDLDVANVQNVIFTRVNPDGDIADWGAKTKDLTIPVDGKNLFTITTSSAVWGDPGCDGEWSVYGDDPTPAEEGFGIILGDGTTIKGQKNEAQIEFLEYMIEADLTISTTFQLYDFANKASWTEGNIDEASTKNVTINANDVYEVAADGKYTIYLKMYGPENNQVYIAFDGDDPTPTEEGFGIILGDGSTIKGQKNEAQIEFLEYMIEADLTISTTFQLYDFANKASWTEGNIDEASTPNVIINGNNVYETVVDGKYTIYLKMYGPENNQVYIAYEASTGLRDAIINVPVKKVMVDGTLYIVKDNKVYTAQGF